MGARCIRRKTRIVVWTTLRNLSHRVIHSGMSALILSVTGLVLLAALVACQVLTMRVVSRTIANPIPATPPFPDPAGALVNLNERLNAVESKIGACMKAVADGIDHVDRNEKRVRGIVTGAKRRFDAAGFEDPGTSAEVESLPEVDEGSGPPEELQPVPEDVGADPWAAVPGMRGE